MKLTKALLISAALLGAPAAMAVPINSGPVAPNAFIVFGGLDWAWALPCPPPGNGGVSGCVDELTNSFELVDGFRLPTPAELAARPSASDFQIPGGNQGGLACASAWFNAIYSHCDFGDGANNNIFGVPGWDGFAETWVVRSAVPEPGSLALLALGLLGIYAAARRRATV